MSQSDLFREMTRKVLAAKLAEHRRKTYLAEYEARRALLRQQFNLDNDSKNAVPNNSLGLADISSQDPPPGLSQRPGQKWMPSHSEKETNFIPDSPELIDMDSCGSSDSSGSNPFDDPIMEDSDEWEIEFDSGSKKLSEKQKKEMEELVTGWINGEYDEQQLADAGIILRVTNRQGKSATWP